jgi:hypothetical protein
VPGPGIADMCRMSVRLQYGLVGVEGCPAWLRDNLGHGLYRKGRSSLCYSGAVCGA